MPFQILIFYLCALASHAFDMDQMDKSQINGANRDFSALVAHTTVSPASGLLKKGFELGLIAGTSSIPNIARAIAQNDPSSDVETRLPNAGLIGLISFAKKLTLEVKIIPEIQSTTMSLGSQSAALKFGFPDLMDDPAIMTALRIQATNAYIQADQQINNSSTANTTVNARTKFTSFSYGVAGLLGYRKIFDEAFLVEPYVGAGVLKADSRYEVIADIPASVFASGSSAEGSAQTGALFMLGAQAHMFYSKLGLEYSRIFDSDKMTLKISFGY